MAGNESPPDADESAAGAQPGDEVRHTSFRLPDDLGTGRVVVRPPVELVVVLVRVEVPRRVGGITPPRLANRAVRAFEGIGQHELRAVGLQHPLPFRRHVVRHAQ